MPVSKDSAAADPIFGPLNEPQRQAVACIQGPLIILAGAGSGKTRVITHRIANLVRGGIAPEDILAITFTNKAAGEMKERVERMLGVRMPWISTFHSFAARLLRRHIGRLPPYTEKFTIYDADDSLTLIKACLKQMDIVSSRLSPRALLEGISRFKNQGIFDPDALPPDSGFESRIIQIGYSLYRDALRERNALDFDDLLLLTLQLFEQQPDLIEKYRLQFCHILIDEFQDTNRVQYLISHRLAQSHRNLCVTGDPDQSIYSWRGADIQNILNFEKDYPDTRIFKLEQNYRSTASILQAANQAIRVNRSRLEKELWTENPAGERVEVHRFGDASEEAGEIAGLIAEYIGEGARGKDLAVFYRVNSMSREIERALVMRNIPYVIVGAIEFYQRREVKDLVAYLRILVNDRDQESLARAINLPPRGLGRTTLERLEAEARNAGLSLLQAVLREGGGAASARGRGVEGLKKFRELYLQLASMVQGPVVLLLKRLIDELDYEVYLRHSGLDNLDDRLANVGELLLAAGQFDDRNPSGSARAGCAGFLEDVALLSAVDRWEHAEDRVSLMTLHSAKGLEFPIVVIAGVEDGLLPLTRASSGGNCDIEEERRLFYVGITRAQRKLFITHVSRRQQYGNILPAIPSQFLEDLLGPSQGGACAGAPPWLSLDAGTQAALEAARSQGSSDLDWESEKGAAADGEEREADVDWDEDLDEDPFPAGCRVQHDIYGEGVVKRSSGWGRKRGLVIDFEVAGEKQLMLGFVKLKRIR